MPPEALLESNSVIDSRCVACKSFRIRTTAVFALAMDLLADLAVLRKKPAHCQPTGRPPQPVDRLGLASSVAVAIGTGIATILAGLQPFVIGVITPSPGSIQPAATSHPQVMCPASRGADGV
jgi:hypothetical protein